MTATMGSLPFSLALPNIITLPSKGGERTTCRRHFGSCQTLQTFVNFDDDTVCCDQKMKGPPRGRFPKQAARAFYRSLNKVGPTTSGRSGLLSHRLTTWPLHLGREEGTGGLLKIPCTLWVLLLYGTIPLITGKSRRAVAAFSACDRSTGWLLRIVS